MNRLRGIGVVGVLLLVSACAGVDPREGASKGGADMAPAPAEVEYRIGVDDVVQVSVWQNPDLSVTVPVRPDGKITVPLVGDVQAKGLRPQEVAADVSGKLAAYLLEPQVAVIVMELNSHQFLSRVRVTGAVRTPRSFPHRPGMTVLDAVLEAGGLNDFAAADRTQVYRREASDTRVIPVRLGLILEKGDLATNIELRPGDMVAVPERLF